MKCNKSKIKSKLIERRKSNLFQKPSNELECQQIILKCCGYNKDKYWSKFVVNRKISIACGLRVKVLGYDKTRKINCLHFLHFEIRAYHDVL